jgi:hypothetical protein
MVRCERIRSHAERSASASWRRKASCSDRKVSGALATRFARYWHLRCQQSWIWRRIPTRLTRRREWQMKQFKSTRPGSAFPRSPRSDQQPFPSPSRSRHCRRIQSCQGANIPGAGGNWRQRCHYDINRRRCLPSRENQADHGRTSCRCPIASSCTPLSCTPLSTKMPAAISVTASGAVFGVTRRTLRCVAVPLRETPTGRRPSTTASNMGCLAGSAGLRRRRDYLISAQA